MSSMRRSQKLLVTVVAISAVGLCVPSSSTAFTFEEADKLDKVEGQELLARARKAADSGSTSDARRFIAQALAKGAPPAQIRAAEAVLAQAEDRADKARRAEEARRQAEADRANRPGGGAGGASAGDGRFSVSVEADCVTGAACFVSNLSVSGGPGKFEPGFRGAGSGAVHKWVQPSVVGRYSYSFTLKIGSQSCVASGSFTLDGTRGIVTLRHYPDCRFADLITY